MPSPPEKISFLLNLPPMLTVIFEFLQSHPLRLVYYWPEYFGQKTPQPSLVYMPDYGNSMEYIDAFTGKTVTVEME